MPTYDKDTSYIEIIDKLKAERDELLDALTLALPYVETALEDRGYKPRVVDRMVRKIRALILRAD